MHPILSRDENDSVFDSRGKPTYHKHVKRSLPSAIGMWEGLCVFWLKCNGPRNALTQKKARIPCSGLNAGSSFIAQDEGMSESPVETLEKALGLRLFWTGGLTSLWHLKRRMEFNASKFDNAWLFVKIERNSNITLPTIRDAWPPSSPRGATVLSCQAYFTFLRCPSWRNRSPDFAEQTRVSNGYRCRNSRIHYRVRAQIEKTHETSPSKQDEAGFHCIVCRGILCSQSTT